MKISEINWGERARKDLGEIEELAEDIKRLGLIHPIVIDETNTLRAGGRRLSALIINETYELIENIHFRYMKDLTELEKQEVELSENVQRKNFTWQEDIDLKQKLHELRSKMAKEKGEEWDVEKTAKELGMGERQLHRDIELAKFVKTKPDILKEDEKNTAKSKMKRIKEEMKRSITVSGVPKMKNLHHGDCLEVMRTLPEHSVDLVLFDPPYGVNLSNTENISAGHRGFQDDKESAMILMRAALKEIKRVLKIGAHCYVFYAMWHHCDVYKIVSEELGGVQPNPLFWYKTNGAGNNMPFKRYTIVYEPLFFCWNFSKQRDLIERGNTVLPHAWENNKKHPAQKPLSLYKELIKMSTHPGEVVLDPMAGSGYSIKAAVELGREGIGIEKDKAFYELMVENVTTI